MSKSSDRRQARREAALQYNPQIDALTSILGGLKTDTRGAVKQARTGARITARSAKNALPEAKKIYRDALAGNTPGQKLIASEAAKLDASSPFAAAINIETGGATTRMQAAKARTLSELVGRRVDAAAGGQQEVRSIREGYRSDKSKVDSQLQSIMKQKGLLASTRYGDLRKDAAGRAVTKRGQDLTAGNSKRSSNDSYLTKYGMSRKDFLALPTVQRQALIDKNNAPKAATKPKLQTPEAHDKLQTQIDAAIREAKTLKAGGANRHEIAAILTNGAEDVKPKPIYVTTKDGKQKKKLNSDGTPAMTDSIPGIKPIRDLAVSVALDSVFDKHLSSSTVQRLRSKKYKARAFGISLNAPSGPGPRTRPKRKTVNLVAGIKVPTS